MKVAVIQVDGKMPNLALMKLYAWHKEKGDEVVIIDLSSHQFDQLYGSKIFMGGSGYDLQGRLPPEIEAITPNYAAFNADYSIVFTSRGCIRDCGFCIVREKEGSSQEMDFKSQILHSKVLVMDGNFLGSSKWKEKLQYFISNSLKVSFDQGLDIRLIDDEKAELLSKVKFHDRNFNGRAIHFAFDNIDMEKVFREKLEILLKYIPYSYIRIYMIVGYDSIFEEDYKRFEIINSYRCDPFVMVYNNRSGKKLRAFARWVNRRIYKKCKFEEYDRYPNGEDESEQLKFKDFEGK